MESKILHERTHLGNRNRLADTENRCVGAKVGGGEEKECEDGISRCKLVYMDWISNKVLLCSTGNYIQYLVINHNGKEYEKEYIYIYIHTHICMYN